jgi:ABC-type phosphate transport system substrate-binding protein
MAVPAALASIRISASPNGSGVLVGVAGALVAVAGIGELLVCVGTGEEGTATSGVAIEGTGDTIDPLISGSSNVHPVAKLLISTRRKNSDRMRTL